MGNVASFPFGIVDSLGVPALAVVPAQFRVSATGLYVGAVGDQVAFPGLPTLTGSWIMGSLRVSAGGLPVITQGVQGISVTAAGSPGGPIRVQTPDPRVTAG